MNIASTQYSLVNKTLEIYLSGCDGACSKSCHNKELWDWNLGRHYSEWMDEIESKLKEFDLMIDHIWILGGEPMLQNDTELQALLFTLSKFNKKIWLWTRFELNEIPEYIIDLFDYIKTGKYDVNYLSDNHYSCGIKLASSNQIIYKVR